ncbi:transporter substrate-binding domain-containing protein [Mesorhizobium sp. SP-1A]|uniref:transporter substrate-binding domain-containing protein n=1 Tax=Mesorhizobium sp. SP-1A TaxID=3077840 RepID=UPI0028F70454|nr:transporter substrate-binding domain-containing protein [Mesorhizobium sp. SP-1A]
MARNLAQAPIKVGVLFSRSGLTAITEQSMLNATLFAIGEVNEAGGIDGRELVPIHYDPAGDPAAYYGTANRLLTEDRVKVIFGCYMSSSRKAVLRAVERRFGLLCYAAQYEGFECSRNAVYFGAAPNQNSAKLGEFLLNNVGTQFYMVGSDYIWPRESDRIMSEMVESHGGRVVGRQYLKLDAGRDAYEPLVAEIKRRKPQVVFCNFVGEAITHFYQAYAEAGLDARTMPIASLTTSESDVQAMGTAAGIGHITCATYFQSQSSLKNRICVERYKRMFGDDVVTNMCWEAAYFQVHIVAEAMRRCRTDDPDVLRAAVLGAEFDAPQGPVRVDPTNAHTHVWPKIGRVGDDGQFQILWAAKNAVAPEPYQVDYQPEAETRELTTQFD